MKTTLVAVLLLTTTVCSAQPARTRENTNGSWNFPNHSIENWTTRNWIIAGATDANPAGQLCPTFKFVNPNLVPVGPAPLPTYRIQFGASKVLMDFFLDQNSGRIFMTGTDPINTSGAPMNMYVTVFNSPNGAVGPSIQIPMSAFSMIPHQIIYSAVNNQVVVVGTKMSAGLTNTNFSTIQKTGFILILNAATLAVVSMVETNTPSAATGPDSDMLESVTELPNAQGYFVGGSANGAFALGEQNMMVTRVTPAGVPGPAFIMDNTNARSVVSSVMYNAPTNQVVVLNNSSSFTNYELINFNPVTVTPIFPAVRHVLNTCLPAGAITSGFHLEQNPAGSQIVVAGYAQIPGAVGLRPFQTTTNPGLLAFINAKIFQSANTSPLTGYFNESGNPPYVNTPDIMTYWQPATGAAPRTFLVNPHSNFGFDMLRSIPNGTLACEAGCQFTTVSSQYPGSTAVAFTQSLPPVSALPATMATRVLNENVLCSSTPLAPMEEETNLEGMEGSILLFPNPAKEILEIEAATAIEEIVVYDLNGSKVLEALNEQNEAGIRMIDINALTPGTYLITLKDSNGNLQRIKFVKE
jgi:hypothetical protein